MAHNAAGLGWAGVYVCLAVLGCVSATSIERTLDKESRVASVCMHPVLYYWHTVSLWVLALRDDPGIEESPSWRIAGSLAQAAAG